MRNRQLPTVISNLLKKRLLLFLSFLLISSTMYGQQYTITVLANPTSGGTVIGGGTYDHGQSCTLTATPNWGYHFVNWTENGSPVSTDTIYTFMVTGNRTLVANFQINNYTITTNVIPSGAGTVTGGGSYNYGDQIVLMADANPGYIFSHWQDGNTQNPRPITVTGNATYTATFTPNQYTIITGVTPEGSGSVSGGGTYLYNTMTQLQANANPGYTFSQWQDGSNENPRTITVTQNATYIAAFTQNEYTISTNVQPTGAGTVTGGGAFDYGNTTTLEAIPNLGYSFTQWQDGNTENPRTITVTGSATYTAIFTLIDYTISVSANPSYAGNVSGGGNTFHYGDNCTVIAQNVYGYTFGNWSENGTAVSYDANYQFTVTGDRTLVANFTTNQYIINTGVTPQNSGTVSGGGIYTYGSTATLQATNNYGYTFDQWQDGNTENPRDVTVTQSSTYTAVFNPNPYDITTDVTPANSGTVMGGGTYTYGSTATLQATNNFGYTFSQWQDGNTENPRVITVTQNATYIAQFTQQVQQYTITTNVTPSGSGVVTGGGTYTYGQTATLTVMANQHYHFVRWQDGNTQNPRQITVTGDATYTAFIAIDQHEITTGVTPENSGTVTGGGMHNYGSYATLTATPAPGYIFQKWQEDDNTQNPRQIHVTGDASYTAKFILENYVIIVNAEPANGGTVTGGGAFTYGSTTTLTATANSGYVFQSWQDGNTQNPRQITVTGNATYTAYFIGSGTTYVVTATVSPEGAGSVTGTGVFNPGATTTLTANANYGYTFQRWQDNITQNPRTVTVNSNMQFTAYFTQITYTIATNVSPAGAGIVTGGGSNFHLGDQVTLTATANEGYIFDHWSDNVTQNPRQIIVTGNATYTACFVTEAPSEYTITTGVMPENSGEVTGGGTYTAGETATLEAIAYNGYSFSQWQDGNSDNPRTIIVTQNATYTATFERNQYTINTEVTPENSGTVEGGGTYYYGEQTTLKATANEGFIFKEWQDGVTTNPRTVTVIGDATYTAAFDRTTCTVTVQANPEGWGSVTGGGQYTFGETCTVIATANEGYQFVNWENEIGEHQSYEPIYSFEVTGDITLIADFAEVGACIIRVLIDPEDAGTATGAGAYDYGQECTLKAFAKLGYHFVNWTRKETGEVVCEVPTYSFIVTETSRYVAHFERNKYTISAIANPEEGGTVSGYGIYYYGVTCTLTAEPNAYYEFLHWKNNDDIIVSETPDYTFQVTADASFTAYFGTNESYTISVSSNNSEWGTVEGGGTFNDGDICRLIARPNEGYVFANWTEDGEVIPNAGPAYEFTVHRSRNLVANFTPDQYYIISAMASGNGSITPQGDIMVAVGGTQSFTMMPNEGCRIIKVLVDGIDVGPVESYTFTNVNRDHTIYAAFSGTGVEEAQSLDINIYPNPAKNKVYVEGDGIETMVLFDMFGNRMLNVDYNTSKELNVSGLPKGQYILVLTTRDGLVGYEKLVLH